MSNQSSNSEGSYFVEEIRRLQDESRKKDKVIEKWKSLIEVNTIISSSLEQKKVLKNLIDQIMILMDCEKCNILLVDVVSKQLKYEVVSNADDMDKLKRINLDMGEGIAGTVWKVGKPFLIDDPSKESRFIDKFGHTGFVTTSILAVPLVVSGKVIGVMEAFNKKDSSSFDYFDLEIFQNLAIQAAIAIENAKLYDMAITDGMTGLFIHKYFQQRLAESIRAAERYNHDMTLIIFDIDHFKKFNDLYGHQLGDEVLIEVAGILKKNTRATDIACRYGGEEFCVILPHVSARGTLSLGERIRKQIEEMEIEHDEKIVKVTISGGIASLKEHHCPSPADIIKKADTALYQSKEGGRNKITVFGNNTKKT